MKTHPHLERGPLASWTTAGIFLIIVGIVMIPFNVVTALGIGLIVGGVVTVFAAFVRSSRSG